MRYVENGNGERKKLGKIVTEGEDILIDKQKIE